MESARKVYRFIAVETLLLVCVTFQMASGLWLVFRGWKQRQGRVAWVQAISGAYLALFIIIHVGAVLFGRSVLHLDTNFYYAAAGMHVHPYEYFFAPYYFLAVLAFFTHTGCALYWRFGSKRVVAACAMAGAIVSLLIVLSLAGLIRPFQIPGEYKATYAMVK